MKMKQVVSLIVIALLLYSCSGEESGLEFREQGNTVPEFNSGNAFQFIEDQLALGPRVPGSDGQREAITYFRDHFRTTAGNRNVYVQQFEQEIYGQTLPFFNLIASFGSENEDRIVIAAHWDSRPRADKDSDDRDQPIPGADDGGSGVAVLMELANIFAEHDLPIGVDIILFDGEDYGEEGDLANYFIGSRYWSQNPPVPNYSPRFGVLLDMVGGEGAIFPKEGHSLSFAPNLVDEIWSIAKEKGYGDLFLDKRGGRVADDHIIVEQYTGIPMINIIHHDVKESGEIEFPPYWHTHNDDIGIIDRDVMQAVGEVMLELIYNRIPTEK